MGLGLVGLGSGARILVWRPLVVRLDGSGIEVPGGRHVAWPSVAAADVEGGVGQARAVVEVDDPDRAIGRGTRGGGRRAPPGVGRLPLRPFHSGTGEGLARLVVWARDHVDDSAAR